MTTTRWLGLTICTVHDDPACRPDVAAVSRSKEYVEGVLRLHLPGACPDLRRYLVPFTAEIAVGDSLFEPEEVR